MELKVLMDGVQRTISGVTLDTTCRDIVLCLAQATQQFGKFTLIEKWQNNERLLNPDDNPIRVLTQWGEYANDITFIIKRCDSNLNEAMVKPSISKSIQSNTFLSENDKNFHLKGISRSQINSDTTSSVDNVNSNLIGQEELLKSASSQSKEISNIHNNNHNSLIRRPKKPPSYYEAIAKSALINSGTNYNLDILLNNLKHFLIISLIILKFPIFFSLFHHFLFFV